MKMLGKTGMTKFLKQHEAQRFDEALMSSKYGFSIDQLMELAGLSVASAIGTQYPLSSLTNPKTLDAHVLVVAGPGNNGGDALVAARHLKHFGYAPSILYPKRSTKPLFQGLVTQCTQLEIPFLDALDPPAQLDATFDLILDGIFGFSFEGAVRAPFDAVLATLRQCATPVVSIDIPSGWHVENGNDAGVGLEPTMLVSLTAPKPCATFFTGSGRVHYVGGRFVPPSLAKEFNLELPTYPGMEQCVRMEL